MKCCSLNSRCRYVASYGESKIPSKHSVKKSTKVSVRRRSDQYALCDNCTVISVDADTTTSLALDAALL